MTDSHLESLYQEAKSALKVRDYEYAIELLKRVLVVDENYKDTSRLLEKAVRLRKLRWYKNPRLWGALGLVVVFVLGFAIAPKIGSLFASPAPTNTISPTATRTVMPTLTPSITPTLTPRPTSTVTPVPSWVTDFAEPILAAIKDRKPDFQDDFSSNEPKGWWAPLQGGSISSISIEEGVMRIIGGGTASNIYLQRQSNFVYQVDISRPNSSRTNIRINNRNSIYLVRNGWGTCRDWSDCGNNYSFSFNSKILVTIIVKDTQAGYYLMGVPVFHYTDTDLGGDTWATPMIDCDASCEIDNVKFWNLDKVPNLP